MPCLCVLCAGGCVLVCFWVVPRSALGCAAAISSRLLRLGRVCCRILGFAACVGLVRCRCALSCLGPKLLIGGLYVTMCADASMYKMDRWRSSNSSTELNIIIRNWNNGRLSCLTHEPHQAPSARSKAFKRQLLTSLRLRTSGQQTPRQVTRHCVQSSIVTP